jgi:hypothetical protein
MSHVRYTPSLLRSQTVTSNAGGRGGRRTAAIRELGTPPDPPKRPIGFVTPEDDGKKIRASKRAKA